MACHIVRVLIHRSVIEPFPLFSSIVLLHLLCSIFGSPEIGELDPFPTVKRPSSDYLIHKFISILLHIVFVLVIGICKSFLWIKLVNAFLFYSVGYIGYRVFLVSAALKPS